VESLLWYLIIKIVIKQYRKLQRYNTVVKYAQNFIQHASLHAKSICR